ncbi:hypothetical protein GEI7407_3127 [Geitlerinema sp. PCC 7407]|nr:hypothetical protein GEI7407_3127 [Geitlerinema sp. PCC 7407]
MLKKAGDVINVLITFVLVAFIATSLFRLITFLLQAHPIA